MGVTRKDLLLDAQDIIADAMVDARIGELRAVTETVEARIRELEKGKV